MALASAGTGKLQDQQEIASVRNRLDAVLRKQHIAEQQANPPFGKPDASSETYGVHFPMIKSGAKLPSSSPNFNLSTAVYAAQRAPEIQSNNPSFPALPNVSVSVQDGRCAPADQRISVNSSKQKNKYLEYRRPVIASTVNTATAPLGLSVAVPSNRDVIKWTKATMGMETSSSASPSSQDISSASVSVDAPAASAAASGSQMGATSAWPSVCQSMASTSGVKRTPPGISLSSRQLQVNRQTAETLTKNQGWSAALKTGPSTSSAVAPPLGAGRGGSKAPAFQSEEDFPLLGLPRAGPSSGGDTANQFKPSTKMPSQQQQGKMFFKKKSFDRFSKL